jgi:hypothetical protein
LTTRAVGGGGAKRLETEGCVREPPREESVKNRKAHQQVLEEAEPGMDEGRDVLIKNAADVLELAIERKDKRLSVAGGEPRYNGRWTNGVK